MYSCLDDKHGTKTAQVERKNLLSLRKGNSVNAWLKNLRLFCIAAETLWMGRSMQGKKCSASSVAESIAASHQCEARSSVTAGGKATYPYPSFLTTRFGVSWGGGGDRTGLYSSFVTVL